MNQPLLMQLNSRMKDLEAYINRRNFEGSQYVRQVAYLSRITKMPKYLETEILTDGCKLESPTKGSFAMNMLFRRNAWEARRGFGQFAQRSSTFGLPSSTGNLPVSPVTNTSLETHHAAI